MTHLDFELMGRRKNVIDIFRLENGKVVEHWDAIQDGAEGLIVQTPSHSAGINRNSVLTDTNKSLVDQFFHGGSQIQNQLLSNDYVEHNSEVLRMTGRLDTYFDRSVRTTAKVHRILGENNFVVVQSEGSKSGRPFVFYDLFNVLNRNIVEHWGVEQEIPEVMPHTNGMI
ncbi:MAG: hypothetical protein C0490_19855 [Marivirga sp.]|nr:hypothetical protein [Marivirga sp.]